MKPFDPDDRHPGPIVHMIEPQVPTPRERVDIGHIVLCRVYLSDFRLPVFFSGSCDFLFKKRKKTNKFCVCQPVPLQTRGVLLAP